MFIWLLVFGIPALVMGGYWAIVAWLNPDKAREILSRRNVSALQYSDAKIRRRIWLKTGLFYASFIILALMSCDLPVQ